MAYSVVEIGTLIGLSATAVSGIIAAYFAARGKMAAEKAQCLAEDSLVVTKATHALASSNLAELRNAVDPKS